MRPIRPLSAADVIRIWEGNQARSPLEQAMAILATAQPELASDDLLALTVGERDARLFALREATFGPRLESFTECPRCGEALEFALEVPALRDGAGGGNAETARVGPPETLRVRGFAVDFRKLTCGDLAAAACADTTEARDVLLRRSVSGARKGGVDIPLDALPRSVLDRLAARLAEADPQAEVLLDLTCPACSHGWSAIFDIAAFLSAELSAHARRLLRDVHALALAYGWREADILGMSGRRRQMYLELVGA